ncbi:MAG: hypothetical protein A3C54_06220 [Deltaproteobacteria bacterium RIFCSPHIGHO2_02_FULL_60_17]|nr:MAG: hypothetical protein A3C54_06220 [Deltaproteobacteria bacterium RIFCSPHIGHO2_02_FULL_60_17]
MFPCAIASRSFKKIHVLVGQPVPGSLRVRFRIVVCPKRFLAFTFGGIAETSIGVYPNPATIETIHQRAAITRDGYRTLDGSKDLSQFFVFAIRHFVTICLAIPTGLVGVRRITVEERRFRIIATNHFNCRGVLELNALQPLDNLGEAFYAP